MKKKLLLHDLILLLAGLMLALLNWCVIYFLNPREFYLNGEFSLFHAAVRYCLAMCFAGIETIIFTILRARYSGSD